MIQESARGSEQLATVLMTERFGAEVRSPLANTG